LLPSGPPHQEVGNPWDFNMGFPCWTRAPHVELKMVKMQQIQCGFTGFTGFTVVLQYLSSSA